MNIFNLFPEWSIGVSVKYAHVTIIHQADNRAEQRSSIRSLPARTITFKIMENAILTVRQINQLLYTIRSEIAVPIFTELFKTTTTGDLYGLTTIPTNDTSNFFNLQKHGGGVIVYDKTGVLSPEFHTMTFADSTHIEIDAITGHIDAANAIFYPAIIGMMTDFPGNSHITDNLSQISFSFVEKRKI
jgi:hypothetical protein